MSTLKRVANSHGLGYDVSEGGTCQVTVAVWAQHQHNLHVAQYMAQVLGCVCLKERRFWPKLLLWRGTTADYIWASEIFDDDETIAKSIAYYLGEREVFGFNIDDKIRLFGTAPPPEALLVCPKRKVEHAFFVYNGRPFFAS